MPRLAGLILFCLAVGSPAYSQTIGNSSDAIWREFGLLQKSNAKIGTANATVYHLKDVTGALAAWQWQRSPDGRPCALDSFCSANSKHTVIASANYLIDIEGPVSQPQLDPFVHALPDRHDTSLPAILTYVPRKNLVPNSPRYVLGSESLKAFAPALAALQPGFDQGAEAEVADYTSSSGELLHLAVFYYPTPEMARLHLSQFKALAGVHAKRPAVLIAAVFGGATEQQANALLGQIGYEANITWNEIPPPSPIKPLYQLLRNIIFLSLVLMALCFVAGLIYAFIRLYRRRFGSLQEDEAMTTLNLSGD